MGIREWTAKLEAQLAWSGQHPGPERKGRDSVTRGVQSFPFALAEGCAKTVS